MTFLAFWRLCDYAGVSRNAQKIIGQDIKLKLLVKTTGVVLPLVSSVIGLFLGHKEGNHCFSDSFSSL